MRRAHTASAGSLIKLSRDGGGAAVVLMCNSINRAEQEQTEGTLFCLDPSVLYLVQPGTVNPGGTPPSPSALPLQSHRLWLLKGKHVDRVMMCNTGLYVPSTETYIISAWLGLVIVLMTFRSSCSFFVSGREPRPMRSSTLKLGLCHHLLLLWLQPVLWCMVTPVT